MTHEELQGRLLDLAYGELAARDAREVEEHAATCEGCRAELASIRGTRQVMSALPVEPAPQGPERILVAAAREAVRGRAPGRAWRRWLWATPVVAASLAAVVAVSLRLGPVRPPSAAHEDPHALRGDSPYAVQAPPPRAAQAPAPEQAELAAEGALAAAPQARERAEVAGTAPPAAAPRRERAELAAKAPPAARDEARATAKKAEAPPRRFDGGESRFATAPEDASAPPPRAGEGEPAAGRYAAAPSAPPAVASAAPPAPAAAAAPADAGPADEARREAPARRAKTAAPEPMAGRASAIAAPAPRERAIAAARLRADQLGLDTAAMEVEAAATAVTWEAWRGGRAGRGSEAPPAALSGRRFWVVELRPRGDLAGGGLTVFVEDGTFRPLAEARGR